MNLPTTDETEERFYDHVTRTVKRNKLIFDIYARDSPQDSDEDMFKIGELVTRSRFIKSLWGDERLFF